MKITESLSSSQQVDALEAAIRSLPGGDAAIDAAVETVLAETGSQDSTSAPDFSVTLVST